MSDPEFESDPVKPPTHRAGVARRRLLRAGLAAAPVVLAVSGRSAMAAACPPTMSKPTQDSLDPQVTGNCIVSSHHPETTALAGFSPSYWKPNPNGQTFQPPCPWPVSPFNWVTIQNKLEPWDSSKYLSYSGIPASDPCWETGTKFNTVFTKSFDGRSFSRIFLDDNGSLNWYLCAAYLNAMAMYGAYAMTPNDVVELAMTGCLVPGGPVLTEGQLIAFLAQTWV